MNYTQSFTAPLLTWFAQHGRRHLPWQAPYDPYRVWVSEIMLQQTQVKTVIPYFNQFIQEFPTVYALAAASTDDVLCLWAGLGYYSRARNQHQTAKKIVEKFQGQFPCDLNLLMELPGIGQSTAAAIVSLAFNLPCTILDGNVKRVLSRYFLIEGPSNQQKTIKQLWEKASLCASIQFPRAYTQAIMDLGATCCTPKNPNCIQCPLNQGCGAYLTKRVNEFPTKKVQQKLPVRKQQFLLLYTHDEKFFLEKRPAHGIWGGLWCFPTLAETASIHAYLQASFDTEPLKIEPLIKLKHVFTHFQLHIEAWSILIEMPLKNTEVARWFKFNELSEIGLPKAVKKLFAHWTSRVETVEVHELS